VVQWNLGDEVSTESPLHLSGGEFARPNCNEGAIGLGRQRSNKVDGPLTVGESCRIRANNDEHSIRRPQHLLLARRTRQDPPAVDENIGALWEDVDSNLAELAIQHARRFWTTGTDEHSKAAREVLKMGAESVADIVGGAFPENQGRHSSPWRKPESRCQVVA